MEPIAPEPESAIRIDIDTRDTTPGTRVLMVLGGRILEDLANYGEEMWP